MLDGRVCSGPDTRFSPAGIPITRFGLEHASQQIEAGRPRQTRCRIGVVAAGTELQPVLKTLVMEKQVRVTGFLSSAGYQSGEFRLVLHAQQIEQLPNAAHFDED